MLNYRRFKATMKASRKATKEWTEEEWQAGYYFYVYSLAFKRGFTIKKI